MNPTDSTFHPHSRKLLLTSNKTHSIPPSIYSPTALLLDSSIPANKTTKPQDIPAHLSMVAESIITFISVFIVGCVILISVYSWKKISESSWGAPSTYQYSALTQFDHDRDEEVNDLEDHLDILVDDSSSSDDNESETDAKGMHNLNAPATLPMQNMNGITNTTATATSEDQVHAGIKRNFSVEQYHLASAGKREMYFETL